MRLLVAIAFVLNWACAHAQVWDTLSDRLTFTATGSVVAFQEYQGDLLLTGAFNDIGPLTANGVALWNGLNWEAFGNGITNFNGGSNEIVTYGDSIVLGGGFGEVDGLANTEDIAIWNGSNWAPLSLELANNYVHALLEYEGDLYVGGAFSTLGASSYNHIARWDGGGWNNVGTGINGGVIWVEDMIEYQGDLYIGGRFDIAGGQAISNIARWDGTQWHDVGGGCNQQSKRLCH